MAGRVVPDRVRWAVDVVDPARDARVLESGCGPGAAAELVCARLGGGGRMLATDRSEVAVRRTAERNATHVAAGRLEVRCSSLADLDVPDGAFDAVFTVNVNLFWTRDPGPELDVVRRALAPGGTLFVLYGGASPTGANRTLDVVGTWLADHGWSTRVLRHDHGIGVLARPPALRTHCGALAHA